MLEVVALSRQQGEIRMQLESTFTKHFCYIVQRDHRGKGLESLSRQ